MRPAEGGTQAQAYATLMASSSTGQQRKWVACSAMQAPASLAVEASRQGWILGFSALSNRDSANADALGAS